MGGYGLVGVLLARATACACSSFRVPRRPHFLGGFEVLVLDLGEVDGPYARELSARMDVLQSTSCSSPGLEVRPKAESLICPCRGFEPTSVLWSGPNAKTESRSRGPPPQPDFGQFRRPRIGFCTRERGLSCFDSHLSWQRVIFAARFGHRSPTC